MEELVRRHHQPVCLRLVKQVFRRVVDEGSVGVFEAFQPLVVFVGEGQVLEHVLLEGQAAHQVGVGFNDGSHHLLQPGRVFGRARRDDGNGFVPYRNLQARQPANRNWGVNERVIAFSRVTLVSAAGQRQGGLPALGQVEGKGCGPVSSIRDVEQRGCTGKLPVIRAEPVGIHALAVAQQSIPQDDRGLSGTSDAPGLFVPSPQQQRLPLGALGRQLEEMFGVVENFVGTRRPGRKGDIQGFASVKVANRHFDARFVVAGRADGDAVVHRRLRHGQQRRPAEQKTRAEAATENLPVEGVMTGHETYERKKASLADLM